MPPDEQTPMTSADVALLNYKLGTLHTDVSDIKGALEKLTEAVTRLALVEQRQGQTATSVERAFKLLENHENRLQTVEKTLPELRKTTGWVDKLATAVVSAVLVAAALKFGALK